MKNEGKKRRVGIITYHRAINYGAILQAYALQKKIKDLGFKCVILDYRNKRLENRHKKKGISDCKNIKDFIRFILLSKNDNVKRNKFREFLDTYFQLSDPLYNLNDLKKCENEYDKFITGSDQVWNYRINDMDPAYFLAFTKDRSKKVSYAASFGLNNIPSKYKSKYHELLSNINTILIREKQGANIIKELLSKEPKVVLDPTLLVTKEEWYRLAKRSYFGGKKYILIYAFGSSRNIINLANNISKKTGYKIIQISNTWRIDTRIKYVKSAGPVEFLGLFKNAQYIITNSFHGTAFSINFNKQFFTEMLPESTGVNSRLEDILELFGLKDRIITSNDTNMINRTIDYNKVNKILDTERQKSLEMLRKLIFDEEHYD